MIDEIDLMIRRRKRRMKAESLMPRSHSETQSEVARDKRKVSEDDGK